LTSSPLDDDNYPNPLVSRPRSAAGLWRVGALAGFFIVAAIVISLLGERIPPDVVLIALGLLAVIGVFSLFAVTAGLFRFSTGDETRTLSRAIVDSLPAGALVTDREARIVYANAQYEQFAGSMADGLPVGVPRLFAGQPEASEAIYRLSRAAREGRPATEDIRIVGGLGGAAGGGTRLVWYRVSVRALPEVENEERRLMLWSVEDITRDRERQDNAFIELQRAIDYLDHAPAGFFSADAKGRIQYLNSTLADWLGHDLAEFQSDLIRVDDIVRGDGASLLMRGRGDGEIRTEIIDIDLVRRNGTTLPVRLLHRAARLADGELGETRTLVLDRSRSATGEEELRAAEIRFSRFFNDTPFAIATLDWRGAVVRTNAPFGRIFNWSGEEASIEGQPMVDLIADTGRDAFRQAVQAAFEHRSEISPVDAALSGPGDRAVRLYISGSEASAQSPERVNVYALDMTEQRKLEAQFAQGQKMQAVGQLAGGVAHDFNNVLTAIIGFSDLLLLKHKPGDPSFQDIMAIKQSANRAAGLTRQLLAFSRRQTLRPQILEVPTHIDDLTVLLKRLIGEAIVLKVDHSPQGVWPVRADLVQLEQVVVNLVVNARDAMPDGGTISIRSRNVDEAEAATLSFTGMPLGEYVLIEVEDTGTGMSPEILEKIFEPFFSTKELGKGTGLGLSTVYGIIKQTGGFIYPESVVGQGTTFRIYLPRHVAAEGENVAKQVAAPVKDLTGHERILLVEDEDNVRAFSARALRATGYEVFEADSGEMALEVLDDEDNRIDLMISDVVMPEMDGPALLVKVRERLPGLKVIFVSGYAEESVRQDIADDQSVEFLAKPYSLDQINSKVKDVLGKVSDG